MSLRPVEFVGTVRAMADATAWQAGAVTVLVLETSEDVARATVGGAYRVKLSRVSRKPYRPRQRRRRKQI